MRILFEQHGIQLLIMTNPEGGSYLFPYTQAFLEKGVLLMVREDWEEVADVAPEQPGGADISGEADKNHITRWNIDIICYDDECSYMYTLIEKEGIFPPLELLALVKTTLETITACPENLLMRVMEESAIDILRSDECSSAAE